MNQSIQIYYIPLETDPDDHQYNVVTVVDGVVVSDCYHEEGIESKIHFEYDETYVGQEYANTPYPSYPDIQTWFDSEESVDV